jgi:hypothetical protein
MKTPNANQGSSTDIPLGNHPEAALLKELAARADQTMTKINKDQ